MNRRLFLWRSLTHYWRTNAAVVVGVATAVAVLGGALLVGDSVRGTLRDLAMVRLGATDVVVQSPGFFREQLADDLATDSALRDADDRVAPLIWREGLVTAQPSGRRVGGVQVYGVDDRFWRFHGQAGRTGPADRRAFVSQPLAAELGVETGAALLVRVERPSDVPLESMHAHREDVGRTVRVTIDAVLTAAALGQFSPRPGQGDVRAIFVPLERMQAELDVERRVNALLIGSTSGDRDGLAERVATALDRRVALGDFGLRVDPLEGRAAFSVESDAGLVDDRIAGIASAAVAPPARPQPVLTYLANTIRTAAREIPYSLVTGVDLGTVASDLPTSSTRPPIVLNEWAARDLRARRGEVVTLDYFAWVDPGRLETRSAEFELAAVAPTRPVDRDLAPRYPGITDSPTLSNWDPPFPLDLRRVRRTDEQYWETYRTTPKAYVRLEDAQRLWRSRFGALTSLRVATRSTGDVVQASAAFAARLRDAIDPVAQGFSVRDVRREALLASTGATDFGQYFVYFSFFLVVSALLLAALFFRLGVEQRAQEVGLLRATGASAAVVRRLFLAEAAVLAAAGAVLGIAGAVAYGWLVVRALSTWWVDAVRTTALTLHVSPWSLLGGGAAGVLAAMACTWWTLRLLDRISERSLLVDRAAAVARPMAIRLNPMRPLVAAIIGAILGGVLVLGGAYDVIGQNGAFFGAGAVLLISGLCLGSYLYNRSPRHVLSGRGVSALTWLGLRNAADRPGRSLLSIAVIASATFMLISVDAFRRAPHTGDELSPGVGGYRLYGESLLPLVADIGDRDVRESLGLTDIDDASFELLRLRPGDDASCLNLYRPQQPRILGVGSTFIARGRFGFRDSLAASDADRENPWRLLEQPLADGAIPAIADANSMQYVLHAGVGDELVLETGGSPIRLRFVASLSDSLFQSEVIIADGAFTRLFGGEAGFRALLVETPFGREAAVTERIESALSDFGMDVSSTEARLAEFHRVENTYLSTFQTLGGLGLVLGTIGLGAVVLRNVLERRRELALLRAVGYERRDFLIMLLAETGSLLMAGLVVGGVSASLAIAPAIIARGGGFPITSHAIVLIAAVGGAGLIATIVAARAATAGALLPSLKSE